MARKNKVSKLDIRKKPKDQVSKHSPYSWLTLDHPQFKVYQDHWYKKIKKQGFKDIEGGCRYTPYFSGAGPTSWFYDDTRELYYRVLTNFLTFNPIKNTKLNLIMSMHNEGIGVYTISKVLIRRQYKTQFSVYWVHYKIKEIVAKAWKWNETHEEGILTEAYEARNDAKILDITLGDSKKS